TPPAGARPRRDVGRDDLEVGTAKLHRGSDERLTLAQALALGVLHGPAELLPISSSGHTFAIPWLVGSRYAEVDPGQRKTLEVALHAGAAAALVVGRRRELAGQLRQLDRRHVAVI